MTDLIANADQYGDGQHRRRESARSTRASCARSPSRQGAFAATAQCAGRGRNPAGLREHRLVRPDGAGGHAESGHRQGLPRHRENPRHHRNARRFYVLGMVPVGNTPAQFADAIREESKHWQKVVRERKISVN